MLLLVWRSLVLESGRVGTVLETSRADLRSALVSLLDILMLSVVILVVPLHHLAGGSLLHRQLAGLTANCG